MIKRRLLYRIAGVLLPLGLTLSQSAVPCIAQESDAEAAGSAEESSEEKSEEDAAGEEEEDSGRTEEAEKDEAENGEDGESPEGNDADAPEQEEIGSGKAADPEMEMRRIGTVSDGVHTIRLGDTREQVLEELGEPLSTTLDQEDVLETSGILYLNDTFEGVTVYYRNYRRFEEDYQWTFSDSEENTDLLDDGQAELVNLSTEESSAEETPDLRVAYIYLENGDYATADGIRCGDPAGKVSSVPTVFGESGIFEQNFYDGEYISWETWNMIYESLNGDTEASIQMMLDTRAVSVVMDPDKDMVQTIIVGDAFSIKYWN